MNPWRPKYKPLYDFFDCVINAAELAALCAVLLAIVFYTI